MKNIFRTSALSVFLLFLSASGYSQDPDPFANPHAESQKQEPESLREIQKNSLYVGVLSINYGRLFPFDRMGVTVSGGLSFVTTLDGNAIGAMLESTLLTGGGVKHFFEPGIFVYFEEDTLMPLLRLGYRYQGLEGFLFRAGGLVGEIDGFGFLPAISLGYSF